MHLSDDEYEILWPCNIATHRRRKFLKMATRIQAIGFVMVLIILVIIYSKFSLLVNMKERLYDKIDLQFNNESLHESRKFTKHVFKNLSLELPMVTGVTKPIIKYPPYLVEGGHSVQEWLKYVGKGSILKFKFNQNFLIKDEYYEVNNDKNLYDSIQWSKKYKHSKTICEGKDWVSCNGFYCQTIPEIFEKMPMISCLYGDFIEYAENKYFIDAETDAKGNETRGFFFSDHIKIICDEFGRALNPFNTLPMRQFWTGIKTGFRPVVVNTLRGRERTPNILILALDSIPHHKFQKYLPRAFGVLTQELNAVILHNYNVNNGINKVEPKSQDKRKLNRNIYLYPDNFLIKRLHDDGYVTGYFTDLLTISSKAYRKYTDHKLNIFFEENDRLTRLEKMNLTFSDINCVGDTPKYALLLNITLQFPAIPEKGFSFTLLSNITDYPQWEVDDNLVHYLKSLKRWLKDTFFIFMTNQNLRMTNLFSNASRSTSNVEYLNQLVFIVLPYELTEERPEALPNLMANRYLSTTPFDIDKTILDVVGLDYDDNVTHSELFKGRSLLEIPHKSSNHGTSYLIKMNKGDFILSTKICLLCMFWVYL